MTDDAKMMYDLCSRIDSVVAKTAGGLYRTQNTKVIYDIFALRDEWPYRYVGIAVSGKVALVFQIEVAAKITDEEIAMMAADLHCQLKVAFRERGVE